MNEAVVKAERGWVRAGCCMSRQWLRLGQVVVADHETWHSNINSACRVADLHPPTAHTHLIPKHQRLTLHHQTIAPCADTVQSSLNRSSLRPYPVFNKLERQTAWRSAASRSMNFSSSARTYYCSPSTTFTLYSSGQNSSERVSTTVTNMTPSSTILQHCPTATGTQRHLHH